MFSHNKTIVRPTILYILYEFAQSPSNVQYILREPFFAYEHSVGVLFLEVLFLEVLFLEVLFLEVLFREAPFLEVLLLEVLIWRSRF